VDLHAVHADVGLLRRRVAGDHERHRDERAGVLRPARQDRQLREVHGVTRLDDFLARPRAHRLRKHRRELRDLRDRFQLREKPFGRLRIEEELEALLPRLIGRDLERLEHPAPRSEEVDCHRHRGAGHVLEEEGRAAGLHTPVRDLGDLQLRRHFGPHADELALRLQPLEKGPEVRIRHQQPTAASARPSRPAAGSITPTGSPSTERTTGLSYAARARAAERERRPSRDRIANEIASRARDEPSSTLKAMPTAGPAARCPATPIAYTPPAPSLPTQRRDPAGSRSVVNRARPATMSGLSHIARRIRRRAESSRAGPRGARERSRAYPEASPSSGIWKTGALQP